MSRKVDHTYLPAIGDRVLVWATVTSVADPFSQGGVPKNPCTIKVDSPLPLPTPEQQPDIYIHANDLQSVAYETFGVEQRVFMHQKHGNVAFGTVKAILSADRFEDDELWIKVDQGQGFTTRTRKSVQRSTFAETTP